MTDDLDNFQAKLDAAEREADKVDPQAPAVNSTNFSGRGTGDAMRLAIDLVAAVVVGGIMGWALDHWLGTKPWFLVIFLIFGLVAGFRNFYVFAGKLLRPDPNSD